MSVANSATNDDSDGDGIPDSEDEAPSDPEDFDGCQDGDGDPDPDGTCDPASGVIDQYDTNGQPGIQIVELNTGIDDYFIGDVSIEQLNRLIDAYFQQL